LSKLETEDVNDGFFHRGLLDIDNIYEILLFNDDKRIIRDIINSKLESYKNENRNSSHNNAKAD